LTRSTSIAIHRVMHRLLVAATQDRKLSCVLSILLPLLPP
jgi:hypothetical protein